MQSPLLSICRLDCPNFKLYVVTRTVTQVSDGASSYTVAVTPPRGVNATVDPPEMAFKGKGEKKSYVVRISAANKPPEKSITEAGKLTWTDGKHMQGHFTYRGGMAVGQSIKVFFHRR
ncbi:hypothetical protein RHGRI_002721 [Rhododendron griersonianum]|uniref:Subtilisin-like protease fibronectin type-III domain-containing protein n=1 Tax=Rhododendron griersonianum TaxID=479676 RepID=A0AAV6LQZ6_9ERIC|nr:hypothetical protein RHGRI_002721 [Rhododendron griersonianum]